MLQSVINGRGSMAQFSHPEFGGSGQWMRGGMIMISDMFNNLLKGRIDALCRDLSALVANEPDLILTSSFQSQSQGRQQQGGSGPAGLVSLFVPPAGAGSGNWWPGDLGRAAKIDYATVSSMMNARGTVGSFCRRLIGVIIFLPGLGRPLFKDDECRCDRPLRAG